MAKGASGETLARLSASPGGRVFFVCLLSDVAISFANIQRVEYLRDKDGGG